MGRGLARPPPPRTARTGNRAGAAAGRQYGFNATAWQSHWDDPVQTALLAFLGCRDRPLSHAYTCAHTDLKNYAWVHIRGLNGGWKSLAAREYRLLDGLEEMDEGWLAFESIKLSSLGAAITARPGQMHTLAAQVSGQVNGA
ncbi:MAG: hypothetical protein IAE79_17040, partial [Anaerolinea sp.]|nr:hypothetical protein [Anaerolinea sp.]